MQKISVAVLIVITFAMLVSPAAAQGHRVGAGINILSPIGDMDDGSGGYVSYMFDISDMLATYVGISRVSGDYDLVIDEVQYKGSYESTEVEAAFLVQWQMAALTPYAGVGGGFTDITFDDMNVGDKLSLFYAFGLLFPVGDNLSLEASARLNYLRPRSYRPTKETIDMDGWLFRLGVTWDF
ncbi:MAG: outer membrane beta-barrel protein [Kiritimatiellae bacterium]|nr:outer membrane beta-barrel protein [Kiritimatiellia bacterium]